MMNKNFCLIGIFLLSFTIVGAGCVSTAYAQTIQTPPDTQSLILELQAQIKALQTRILQLEAELGVTPEPLIPSATPADQLATEAPASITLPIFDRTLSKGMSGDDVRNLQQFLAQFSDVYPEGLITGYYGPLTEKAVQRWQAKEGIIASGTSDTTGYGRIGPKTRARLNNLAVKPPHKKVIVCHIPSDNQENKQMLEIAEPALKAHLAHGDYEGACEIPPALPPPPPMATTTPTITATSTPSGTIIATSAQPIGQTGTTTVPATPATPAQISGGTTPPPSTTPPSPPPSTATTTPPTAPPPPPPSSGDTTAPTISNVQSFPYSSWGKITWNTNESADGKVEYGLTSSYGSTAASSTLEIYHAIYLSNLSSNTTYHYHVTSKDAAGNAITSGDYTFMSATVSTPPPPPPTSSSNVLRVSSPNGGEQWQRGQTYQIQWENPLQNSTYKNLVWAIIAVPGGNDYTIVYGLPVTQSSYSWTIPTASSSLPNTSGYRVRVQLFKYCIYLDEPCVDQSQVLPNNKADYGYGDESDNTFTISAASAFRNDANSSLALILQSLNATLDDIQKQIQKLLR